MNNKPSILKNNLYFLGLIAKISPWRIFHAFLSTILDRGVWAFFTVVFMRYLFDSEEIARSFSDVAIFLVITSAVILVIAVYESWFHQIYTKREDQIITFALNREIFNKATSVDISCYENPDFYDEYTKAATEASTRAQAVLEDCANLVGSLISSIFVLYFVFTISIVAGIISFLPLLGIFVFGKIAEKINYNWEMEDVPNRRRMSYVHRVMYLGQYANEIRLTKIYSIMRKTYNNAFSGVNSNIKKYGGKMAFFNAVGNCLNFPVVFEGVWLLAAYLVMVNDTMLLGDFIVLANAVVAITWMLLYLQTGLLGSVRNGHFIKNIRSFLEHSPKIYENQQGKPVNKAQVLELKNISFKYTDDGDYVLKNISITIKSGEKIALVGHNGTGKTTLVKLIMRLYDPTEGVILLNGTDIREYDLQEYRAAIGVAFQDYQIFSLSVLENVIMNRISSTEERERAIEALKESDVYDKVNQLPKKEDTVLTREFDDEGAVMSGGEYQKIAIARAFAKNAGILIMDEPSSALDPVAEYMMYETIMRLCERKENVDKIAIIISHRLSSAISTDCIYLLEKGEIVEHGAHYDLIKKGGAYAEMYFKQAKNYLADMSEAITEEVSV